MDDNFRDIDEVTSSEIIDEDMVDQEIESLINKKETPRKGTQKTMHAEDTNKALNKTLKEESKKESLLTEQKAEQQKGAISTEKKTVKKELQKNTKKKNTKKKQLKNRPIKAIKEKKNDTWLIIIAVSIGIVTIVLGLYFVFTNVTLQEQSNTIAAIVNGEPIYNDDLNMMMKIIQKTNNPYITREQVLNDTINRLLLVQEAKKEGFKVTNKEVEDNLKQFLSTRNITIEEFAQNLKDNDLNYDKIINFYKEEYLVVELINKTIISTINVRNDEIKKYYEENINLFKIPEAVEVRHILLKYNEEPENDTLRRAQEIKRMVNEDKSNFCELVKKYTDDIVSANTCGEYNFTKEALFAPEFITAGFNMSPGDVEIIKTLFGYHIIYKVKDIPAKTLALSEVKNNIELILKNKQIIQRYNELINELRQKAVIEIYTDTINYTYTINSSLNMSDKEDTTTKENKIELISGEPRKDTVQTNKTITKSFTQCVSENAIMYTVYWAPDNEAQLEVFGSDKDLIKVVECDPDAKGSEPEKCNKYDFVTYPSWVIKNQVYNGMLSKNRLSEATGCPY